MIYGHLDCLRIYDFIQNHKVYICCEVTERFILLFIHTIYYYYIILYYIIIYIHINNSIYLLSWYNTTFKCGFLSDIFGIYIRDNL
jgi:hypothetical protein